VAGWKKPIHIGRHAYGDVYANREIRVTGPGTAEMVFTPRDGGKPVRKVIHEFAGPGIVQGIHNLDTSIRGFAAACFTYALDQKIDLWFGTKDPSPRSMRASRDLRRGVESSGRCLSRRRD
jgi:isocitrate dehydrogenase